METKRSCWVSLAISPAKVTHSLEEGKLWRTRAQGIAHFDEVHRVEAGDPIWHPGY